MKPVLKKQGNLKPVRNINLRYKRLSLNIGTLEESRNTFLHFEKSQEILGRCMAEMIDEIRKGRNGEQS